MRSFTVVLGLVLVGLALLFFTGRREDSTSTRDIPRPMEGFRAPEIHGEDVDGVYFKLSEYKGNVILLDFHAEWCGPCRMFYPRGRKIVTKYKDRPFVMLGVNLDHKRSTAKAAFDNGTITWRSWWDGTGEIAERWRVKAFPTFILIDAKGVIRARIEGLGGEEIEDGVNMLVKEAEGNS